jgi:organic hydroperoxide reductase OsmC/OhrA
MPDVEIASWTPEDLFIAAVNACTMTTFLALADRMAITVESYDSDALGTLERVNNTFRFTEVVLRPKIVVADASLVDDTRKALDQAHQQCLVGNSIRGVLILEPAITFLAED